MRVATLAALATLGLLPLCAQIDPFYQSREALAPHAAKARLTTLRKAIESKQMKYQVGYTKAMERPLEKLAGFRGGEGEFAEMRAWAPVGNQLLDLDRRAQDEFLKKNPGVRIPDVPVSSASSPSFDWRRYGKVPPIRDQGLCGSCWAFSVAGTWECANLIRNNILVDSSEEALLSCAKSGNCNGGKRGPAFNYLVGHGICHETEFPYVVAQVACHPHSGALKAASWGPVDANNPAPSVAQIKQAIVLHGPISTVCYATEAMQAYTGGVFSEAVPNDSNHAVILIGWDDAKGAWLMRNSWGAEWGETCGYGTERGYAWVAYNSSNLGRYPCWVRAAHMAYPISEAAKALIQKSLQFLPR